VLVSGPGRRPARKTSPASGEMSFARYQTHSAAFQWYAESCRESPMLRLNPAIAMVRPKRTSHPAAALPRR